MEISRIVEEAFEELEAELAHMLEGLSLDDLNWKLNQDSNSISFLMWHIGRAEDIFVSDYALRQAQVFERGGWSDRWGIEVDDTGFGYGRKELDAYPNPPLDEIAEYRSQVRAESLAYLKTLSGSDFDVVPASDHPRRRDYTIGRVWSHLICEIAQHVGQISYIRGLQKGLNQRGSVGDWKWINRDS